MADVVVLGSFSSENLNANNSATFTNDIINCLGSCLNSFFVNQSSNLTLVNVTFNFSSLNISGGIYSRAGNSFASWVNVSWYVQANVTNSSGAVANSYVNFTNYAGSSPAITNILTNAQGVTPWELVTQFYGNQSSNQSYVPWNVLPTSVEVQLILA